MRMDSRYNVWLAAYHPHDDTYCLTGAVSSNGEQFYFLYNVMVCKDTFCYVETYMYERTHILMHAHTLGSQIKVSLSVTAVRGRTRGRGRGKGRVRGTGPSNSSHMSSATLAVRGGVSG